MPEYLIPPDELNDYLRKQAYLVESDPLFFMQQRGEVPAGTWEAKVEEIKARYPK
jgi:hypothetical protein